MVPVELEVARARACSSPYEWSDQAEKFRSIALHVDVRLMIRQAFCRSSFPHVCSVLPRLEDGQELGVVVKLVDLNANSYRNKQHRDRSTQSYKVESGFYKHFAPKLYNVRCVCIRHKSLYLEQKALTLTISQATARIPELLHEQWQPNYAGLTIVMEDLRGSTKSQSTTRLTHQALALNYNQV